MDLRKRAEARIRGGKTGMPLSRQGNEIGSSYGGGVGKGVIGKVKLVPPEGVKLVLWKNQYCIVHDEKKRGENAPE